MSGDESNEVLIGGVEKVAVSIVDYDPTWPNRFEQHAKRIRHVLGIKVIKVEHIGSTSVPDLSAKPIIDVLLVVKDSGDEGSYLPQLENAGYQLRVREPEFHEHRMVRTPERDVHIHIFSPDSPEIERYLTFRDRLRGNARDRARYEKTKRALAAKSWLDMNAYAEAKTKVIEDIIEKGRRDR